MHPFLILFIMAGVLGALGAAALDFGVDTASNYLQGKMDVSNSKELMRYNNQQYLDMQSKLNQRLYQEQVASMRMAGLNPAMISGPMSQSASMSSASQNKQAARMDMPGAMSALSQMSLNESQRQLNEASANSLNADAELKRQQAQRESFMNDTFWDEYAYRMANTQSGTQLNTVKRDQIIQSVENLKQELYNLQEVNANLKREGRLTEEYIKQVEPQSKAQIAQALAQANYMTNEDKRRVSENTWEVEKLAAETSAVGMDYRLKIVMEKMANLQAELIDKYGDAEAISGIFAQIFNGIASGISAGAAVKSAGKAVPMNSTTTTNTYNAKGVHTGTTQSTTSKY